MSSIYSLFFWFFQKNSHESMVASTTITKICYIWLFFKVFLQNHTITYGLYPSHRFFLEIPMNAGAFQQKLQHFGRCYPYFFRILHQNHTKISRAFPPCFCCLKMQSMRVGLLSQQLRKYVYFWLFLHSFPLKSHRYIQFPPPR